MKTGKLEGQCLFYDMFKGNFRVLGVSHFSYDIRPKANICKITFVNGKDTGYAAVKVEAGKSISDNSVPGQKMPAAPSKAGFSFKEWNTQEDGQGKAFTKDTVVSADMTVYAVYDQNSAPSHTEATPETQAVVELPPEKHRVAKTGESAYFGGFSAMLCLALAGLTSLRKRS